MLSPLRLSALALALTAAHAQNPNVPPGNWTMEAGGPYRESMIGYNGAADNRGAARFFYASLTDGSTYCDKPQPDTASATPVMYNDVWIVADCTNHLLGFANPDKLGGSGGTLSYAWRWSPNPQMLGSPLLATPVIDPATGMMYVLYKDPSDAKLYGLQLNGGSLPPTLVWTVDLASITGINDNGQVIAFKSFLPDHAILFYGGKVWIPSNDFDGALVVDPSNPNPVTPTVTTGLYDVSHRLQGSCGGAAKGWQAPVFLATGSLYGFQSFDPATGNRSWWSDNTFYVGQGEFSHPVAVTFASWQYGLWNCIIGTSWQPTGGGLWLSAADANSSAPCGQWGDRGYFIRHPALAMPTWVSAPAVMYDGWQTVYLVYAVVLPSGDRTPGGSRTGWKSALVTIQADQTGPYDTLVDVYVMTGVHFNAAPLVIRDAWGPGNHIITVGGSDANLYVFPAKGYSQTGPVITHSLIPLLPPPDNPAYPNYDNRRAGISGNYLSATSGGSIAFIVHNPDAEMNWFGVVTGAMYSMPSDPSPSPTPRPVYYSPSPSPAAPPSNAPAAAAADATGAVLGTLGGLAAVSAAIVFFAPTASFMVGATRVVPADIIKGAASATWSGVKAVGGAVGSMVSGAAAPSAGSGAAFASSGGTPYSGSYSGGGERAGLLSGAKAPASPTA